MLFNSGTFFTFLVAFLLLYGVARRSLAGRNWLIVGASYLFYGWWDWRFLGLLLGSSLVDYFVGRALEGKSSRQRKRLLALSLAVNLGALGLFKYFDFFAESLRGLLSAAGVDVGLPALRVILPVGISFYTFQSLSYTIDVYRGKVEPTRHLGAFLAYVSFFPQLVAGPIERASNLLPQFLSERDVTRNGVEQGLWLVIAGLFKKVVIADNLAPLVDMVYGDPSAAGLVIALATAAFGFQIYCDFSGYSDIARGVAKLLGFDLMLNFNLPYFATTPRDFWRRWHISLSTWFRDYVYIPLGGNRTRATRAKVNLLLTMLVAGLWHGAGWNFVLWGLWHGAALAAFAGFAPKGRMTAVLGWAVTMVVVFYGWLLFRAESLDHVASLTFGVFDLSANPVWLESYVWNLALFTIPLIAFQAWQFRSGDLTLASRWPIWARAGCQAGLIYLILLFWDGEGTPFIYFQF